MTFKQKVLLALLKSNLKAKVAARSKSKDALKTAAWIAAGGAGLWLAARAARNASAQDLRGQNVLITGGSRGLGLELAREFLRKGARVAICARAAEELEAAMLDLWQIGGVAVALTCDLTVQTQVEALINAVHEQLGGVDILVNNAGVIAVGPLEEMRLADFEEAMATNYWAALYTTLAVLPEMRARQAGHIVNISSIGGKLSVPHLLPYSASKFALTGLSAGLRAELKKDGIQVTTVCPGLMRTGSPRNATFKGQHRAEYAWFALSDALPLTSMNAARAARRIVQACERGEAEVVLSVQAKLAVKFQALFPGVTADLLGQVNRLLPGPGGIGSAGATGAASGSAMAPSWLTTLSDEAAVRNNQLH